MQEVQLGRKEAGCVGRIRRERIKEENEQGEYDRKIVGQERGKKKHTGSDRQKKCEKKEQGWESKRRWR